MSYKKAKYCVKVLSKNIANVFISECCIGQDMINYYYFDDEQKAVDFCTRMCDVVGRRNSVISKVFTVYVSLSICG